MLSLFIYLDKIQQPKCFVYHNFLFARPFLMLLPDMEKTQTNIFTENENMFGK